MTTVTRPREIIPGFDPASIIDEAFRKIAAAASLADIGFHITGMNEIDSQQLVGMFSAIKLLCDDSWGLLEKAHPILPAASDPAGRAA